jgi:hypothetical protein
LEAAGRPVERIPFGHVSQVSLRGALSISCR